MIISGTILSGTIAYSTPGVAPTSGQLWTFGSQGQYFNGSAFVPAGQLGDGTNTNRSSPVQVLGGTSTWASISFADGTSHAIKTDGTLWGWGNGQYGELGNNNSKDTTTPFLVSSPIQTVAGGTSWSQVSASRYNVGAIKTDGTLWIWGSNIYGQLGDNTRVNKSSPVQTVAAGTNWTYVQAGYVSGGLKSDNTLWMWGQNSDGQIGDGTITNRSSPVQIGGAVWSSFSAGETITAAIRTDGTLWLWGGNYFGGLGTNSTTKYSSPVQTVSGGSNWSKVSASIFFTNAIKTDGTLWSWGHNSYGQLGDNTRTNRSSPVQIYGGGTNWSKSTASGSLGVGIKTDGTIWGWGRNNYGQLGNGTIADKSSPTQIGNSTNWVDITAARFGSMSGAVLGSGPPTPGTAFVEILLVAGGGAGGGSGGGAGGLLYYGSETPKTPNGSARIVSASTVYTITIGGGGTSSGNGSNTSISGTGLSLTALGGTGSTVAGQTGGSGNGADRINPSIIGFGTAGQGYNGGTGNSGNNSSGGGGGAGGLGGNSGANGGTGGIGLTYSISGSAVGYGGGGGGGGQNGAGSASQGGGAGSIAGPADPGTTNTGGGGGGIYNNGPGNGGSGIVIIRYPDSYANAVSTTSVAAGYPVISGGYKIYKWITSGSITF